MKRLFILIASVVLLLSSAANATTVFYVTTNATNSLTTNGANIKVEAIGAGGGGSNGEPAAGGGGGEYRVIASQAYSSGHQRIGGVSEPPGERGAASGRFHVGGRCDFRWCGIEQREEAGLHLFSRVVVDTDREHVRGVGELRPRSAIPMPSGSSPGLRESNFASSALSASYFVLCSALELPGGLVIGDIEIRLRLRPHVALERILLGHGLQDHGLNLGRVLVEVIHRLVMLGGASNALMAARMSLVCSCQSASLWWYSAS